jgi:hypothetical protein
MRLVDYFFREWFGESYNPGMDDNTPDLNLDALEAVPLRKKELPPFKIQYQTFAEIKLRLLNSIISVKGHPFVVGRIRQKAGDFTLYVYDKTSAYKKVQYSDLTDLRSIPPMYVRHGQVGWLCRWPGRVYQQGITKSNTLIRTADGKKTLSPINTSQLIKQLAERETHVWDSTTDKLMRREDIATIRLSDDIAVMSTQSEITACYRGRPLGTVQENVVTVFDEDDLLQSWIETPARDVGLELRAG